MGGGKGRRRSTSRRTIGRKRRTEVDRTKRIWKSIKRRRYRNGDGR